MSTPSYAEQPGTGLYAVPTARHSSAFLDETRQGSAWQQIGVGIVGILLAITLIVGQITVATTRGIHANLSQVVGHMNDGNKTMAEIIAKAEPSVEMEKTVGRQALLLGKTRDSMVVLNDEMDRMGRTTDGLTKTVRGMRNTGRKLDRGVANMNRDTARMEQLLGKLPAATDRTHRHLTRMSTDSRAIVGELDQLTGKMRGYGLVEAKNVRRRR